MRCDVGGVRDRVRALLSDGSLDLPSTDGNELYKRWERLAGLGGGDLCVAKLAESHADAVQILRDAGRDPVPDALYAVWASESRGTGLLLHRSEAAPGCVVLDGVKRFCSGGRTVDRALVTASTDDGLELVEVELPHAGVQVTADAWPPSGMAGADTVELTFDGVVVAADDVVGDTSWYVGRPGFWVGGIGVAAVWVGAIRALVARLAAGAARPHAPDALHVHHAAAASRLLGCEGALLLAADRIARHPDAEHRVLALAVRQLVERTAVEVLDRCARALGAAALVQDEEHARRVEDLAVYVRQHNAERDLLALSHDLLERR